VILFTGHLIDPPGTMPPRFPDSLKARAREAILSAVQKEIAGTDGDVIAIAGCASGGDLLFHDVCEELKIEHRPYLPLPPDRFRTESVSPAGPFWEDQFDRLLKGSAPLQLAESTELPLWLSVKKGYTGLQRANFWLIHEAMALNAKNFTLIALWDGVSTEGPDGTYHMRTVAQQQGAAVVTIYIADLAKANPVGM
jgi:hypothetical protein